MKNYSYLLLSFIFIAGCGFSPGNSFKPYPFTENIKHNIQKKIGNIHTRPSIRLQNEHIYALKTLTQFYESRSFKPAWCDDKGINSFVQDFVKCIQNADLEALNPDDYHLLGIQKLINQIGQNKSSIIKLNPGLLADIDLLVTDAFLLYASHLLAGRVDPETFDPQWHAQRREADLSNVLIKALEKGAIKQSLMELTPQYNGYRQLRDALRRYKKFHQNGLPDTNAINIKTIKALNTNREIKKIQLNMERWRWLPHDLGKKYILVNIADFKAEVIEDNRQIMEMKVMVGKNYRQTPVFSGKMIYLVLSPYWNIPKSIMLEDKLPLIRQDPRYPYRAHIEVLQTINGEILRFDPNTIDWNTINEDNYPYDFRMKPGPWNPLGQIKFMFPNKYNVYIHDTPSKGLFANSLRTFSSGCIRIEKAMELAEYLLNKNSGNWNRDKIESSLELNSEEKIKLDEPIMVHILYWTAWVSEDNIIHFREDIYGRDELLEKAYFSSRTN